VQSAIDITI